MADLPAPQHSATLNRLVDIPDPEPEPLTTEEIAAKYGIHPADIVDPIEEERLRIARRRAAAGRARLRRHLAA